MNASRRRFLQSVAASAGGVALVGGLPITAAFGRVKSFTHSASAPRPNVLYINSHDTGRFTSPYGYDVATPNLQQLAEDGMCFLQAHCAAPTCSASRASLLTGECSHSNGMLGLTHRGFELYDYHHHILHTLRDQAGYYAALIGLQHVAPHSSMIGYDHVQDIPGNHVEKVAPAAVGFLRNHPKQPFWLEVGFFETHRPYREATSQDNPKRILPPGPIPNVPETRRDMANFHASARRMDWGVGQVLAALEEAGLAENTLVISATDHGIAFPDMKANLYDGGTGVHFVMRGPGGFEGGQVCEALISHIDVFSTLCDLLQIQRPSWLQGKSFLPVVRGQVKEINDAIFAELNYHAAYEPKRSVRTTRWKYIRHYSPYPHPTLPNCDDGPSKTYWVQNGWGQQMIAKEELFDLTFDPAERNNLVSAPEQQTVLQEMRQKLHAWMESTLDPLLKGPVPAPSGAHVNLPDQLSPSDPVQTIR